MMLFNFSRVYITRGKVRKKISGECTETNRDSVLPFRPDLLRLLISNFTVRGNRCYLSVSHWFHSFHWFSRMPSWTPTRPSRICVWSSLYQSKLSVSVRTIGETHLFRNFGLLYERVLVRRPEDPQWGTSVRLSVGGPRPSYVHSPWTSRVIHIPSKWVKVRSRTPRTPFKNEVQLYCKLLRPNKSTKN